MDNLAGTAVLLTAAGIVLRGLMSQSDPYAAFLRGAKKGIQGAMELFPALCAMSMMLSLISASGLTQCLTGILRPLMQLLNLPEEVAPVLLLRPVTGSGSLSVLQGIFEQYGADSRVGRVASVLMGSSETIVYTMTVYLGAAGVKKLPDVMWISLTAYLAGAAVCGLVM